MMSSVWQGVQSHVESHILSFQLFALNPRLSGNNVHKEGEEVEENWKRNRGEDCNGNGNEEEKAYVHSDGGWSRMSKKSLEMCTEGLGSESGSGSDTGEIENDDIPSLLSFEEDDHDFASPPIARSKANRRRDDANSSATTLPPPLTSLSGSIGIRMESYREDGRLVLTAVATGSASRTTYFHAERTKGRLKLHLVKLKHMEEEEAAKESHGEQHFTSPCSCSCTCNCKHTKELLNWEPLWVST